MGSNESSNQEFHSQESQGAANQGAVNNKHLPGEEGIWVFVLGDMIVFALFFCIFVFYRSEDISLYQDSRQQLDVGLGVVNTLLLLTSSWLVVTGVHAFKDGRFNITKNCIGMACLCGLGFAVLKIVEYQAKIGVGITPATNDFFMFYFLFTGIHFVHVLVGIAVLAYVFFTMHLQRSGSGGTAISEMTLESSATYWHMVDLLWIILFPLIYLLP